METEELVSNRRRFIQFCAAAGLGSTLLPGTLTAVARDAEKITPEMVGQAASLAGLSFPTDELTRIADSLNGERSFLENYRDIRQVELGNQIPPALVFDPRPSGFQLPRRQRPWRRSRVELERPSSDEDLAFLPVTHLAKLIETRQVSSMELTRLYLGRLKRHDPVLHCVVTLTEELALQQAADADREISAGRYRGPLQGIPWGAKDLLAVRGYPTTWGATPYREQVLEQDSAVYRKLTEAGAVLVAKLTTGALAIGDRWFGGQTKSPWDPGNPERGSSGSSAGPASATAAGLVGFSIGTETRGSIISPASRCGVTGLRPTFGRVSRYGTMTLSWSMDKIGPICRSAEDCALVLRAICGPDGHDRSVLDVPFNWNAEADLRTLRVGYLESWLERAIEEDPERPERTRRARESQLLARQALEVLRSLGLRPTPVELPDLPHQALGFILSTEAAAAFDDLMRSGRDLPMRREPEKSIRPDRFRLHRFVPAVEYLQANRVRSVLIEKLHELFSEMDLLVGSSLALTNLTGHPELTMPAGFDSRGQPADLRLTGKLFGDSEILRVAHAFQTKTDFHRKDPRPRLRAALQR